MTQYLITIHRPEDYDATREGAAMGRAIDAVNDAMVAAGVRVFVGGLQAPAQAHALRVQADGTVHASAGPYRGGGEHVGGLWIIDAQTMQDALAWGSQAALACRAHVEVRPFH